MFCHARHHKTARGFTLVELAIVMIIIGLLIAGVLKGEELVNNARVHATIAQIKAIDAAMNGFIEKHNGIPGDLRNAATTLSNCTAAPCLPARVDSDGHIDYNFLEPLTDEAVAAFPQLAASGFLARVAPSSDPDEGFAWGGNFPAAAVGGGFHLGYLDQDMRFPGNIGQVIKKGGHYLLLNPNPVPSLDTDTGGVMTPQLAGMIDRKIDDGIANAGNVLAGDPSWECTYFAGGMRARPIAYRENFSISSCDLYVRTSR